MNTKPNAIHFYSNGAYVEIMRMSPEGIWANPDVPVDGIAKQVLEALDSNIKLMVQRAVENEREACAKLCETEWSNVAERMYGEECAATIRARNNT
jgi:hypothetical protein